MQALFDALGESTTFVVIAVAATVFAAVVLLAGARRTRMDDAVQAETLAAAVSAATRPAPVVVVDVDVDEEVSFRDVLALLAAHRDDIDSDPFPAMPKAEALLRTRRVRAS